MEQEYNLSDANVEELTNKYFSKIDGADNTPNSFETSDIGFEVLYGLPTMFEKDRVVLEALDTEAQQLAE